MGSSVAEQREPRARNATVSEESLTVDLTDGVLSLCLWFGTHVFGTESPRNAITLRFLAMEHTFTGLIWMKT
jgi:hypothetical protein